MSEQIREQISAFLDGELPTSETELLLKRLTRDAELRESFGRYALIGEAVRGASRSPLTRGFAARINAAIDGEPAGSVAAAPVLSRSTRWWRPIAGAAVAAGVAAVAVVALQQRTVTPPAATTLASTAAPPSAHLVRQASEPAQPYVTPKAPSTVPAMLPAARLTNYIFAHSRYSSVLGQSNVLSGLLADPDEPATARPAPGATVNDAALHQLSQDAHTAP